MATIASLVVTLAADISNFKENTEKAGKHASSLQNTLQTGLGVALGIGLAKAAELAVDGLQKLVGIMTDAFNEAQKSEIVNVKLEQALRNTGYQVVANADAADALAQRFRDLAGGEDDSVKGAETVLLRFKEIGRQTFPQALQVSADLAAAMGVDMPAAAEMLGRALENPATGLKSLRAAGVNFNEAELGVVKSLMDTGRAAEAQQIVMTALAGSVGGMAAAAADTMSGRWAILKNHMDDAVKGIAEKMLPILERLFDQFIKPMIPVIEKFADGFGTDLANGLNAGITQLDRFFQIFSGNMNTSLVGFDNVMYSIIKVGSWAGAVLMNMWNTSFFVQFLKQAFGINASIQMSFLELVASIQDNFMNFVYYPLKELFEWRIAVSIQNFVGQVKYWFNERLPAEFERMKRKIDEFLGPNPMRTLGDLLIRGIGEGIQAGWMWLLNAINWVATQAINAFKRTFGIYSPSRVFRGFGINLMEGLASGIRSAADMPQVALDAAMPSAGMNGISGRGASSTVVNNSYNYNAAYQHAPANDPVASFGILRAMVSQ